ncbi:MAG: hypothetical protein ACJ74O_11815 [Frankiaceae bacterium]
MQYALLSPDHADQRRKALRDAADAHRRSYAVAEARRRSTGASRRRLATRWMTALVPVPHHLALPKR